MNDSVFRDFSGSSDESSDQLRRKAMLSLRSGDFALAERAIANGAATWQDLVENLRIYQAELQMQAEELRRSQEQVEEALNRFTRLFDNLPLPALLIDANGVVLEANQRAESDLGMPGPLLRGHLFHRLVHSDDYQAEVRGALLDARNVGRSNVQAVRFKARAGTEMLGDLHIQCLQRSDLASLQYACIVVDRTEQMVQLEALESSLAQLSGKDDGHPKGALVLVTDAETRVVWASQPLLLAVGHDVSAMQKMLVKDLARLEASEGRGLWSLSAVLDQADQLIGLDLFMVTPTGKMQTIRLSPQPMMGDDGLVTGYVLTTV